MTKEAENNPPQKNNDFDLAKEILKALKNLTVLEIRTMVGDVTVSGTGGGDLKSTYDGVPSIESRLNMLSGDIDTAINNKFVDDPNYKFLLDYHANREDKGFQMVQDNVKALMSLLNLNARSKQE